MQYPTEEEVRERFLRLFVTEHTDGCYNYVTLRNTEESPDPCGWNGCPTPVSLRTFDVEDGCSGGAGLCQLHYDEHHNFREDGEPFYKPTGVTAEEAWSEWKSIWPLFAAPGWAQSDWPELEDAS